MRFLIHILAALGCMSLSCATAADIQTTITLEQGLGRVIEYSPVLKGARYQTSAAEARVRAARLPTPLSVKIELENFAGSGKASGTDILESTLSLARVLETGNQTNLRGDLARQKADLLQNEQDSRRLDLLATTTDRFVSVVSDQEMLEIARKTMKLARHTFEVIEARYKAGKAPASERSRAVIELARTEIELKHAEHKLAASRLRLAATWGDTSPHFDIAEGDLFALDEVVPFDQLKDLLDRNPDLVRFATAQRLAAARTRLARADRRPDIDLYGGVRYLRESEDVALVVSASVPFGTRQRAAPSIEEAEMLALAEPLAQEQRRLELYTTLFEIHQELMHSRSAVETLRQRIIPESRKVLRDLEKGYAQGHYSFVDILLAQRTLLKARIELVSSAADYHRYRAEIDRLTGARLLREARP